MNEIHEILDSLTDGMGRTFLELIEKSADKIIFSVISRNTEKWKMLCEKLNANTNLDIDVQLVLVLMELKKISNLGNTWHKNLNTH